MGSLPDILDLPIWSLVLMALFVSALGSLATYELLTRVFRVRHHTGGLIDHRLARSLRWSFTVFLASQIAGAWIPRFGVDLSKVVGGQQIHAAWSILSFAWLIASLWDLGTVLLSTRISAEHNRAANLLLPFARVFGRFAIFVIALVVLAAHIGYDVRGVIAGLGIGGAAIALASKDSIENFFGAVTLALDLPFGVGDWVKTSGVEGNVERIGLRSTRIRTFEDSLVTLPNSNLIRASVENMGARRYRRMLVKFNVMHDAPVEAIEEFVSDVRQLVRSLPDNIEGKDQVSLVDLTNEGSTIQVVCYFGTDDYGVELADRQTILTGVLRLAAKHDLKLGIPMHHPSPPSEEAPDVLPG